MKRVSKIVWSSRTDKDHALMREECVRVASLGGAFTIDTVYASDWYTIYAIEYPETVDALEKIAYNLKCGD